LSGAPSSVGTYGSAAAMTKTPIDIIMKKDEEKLSRLEKQLLEAQKIRYYKVLLKTTTFVSFLVIRQTNHDLSALNQLIRTLGESLFCTVFS